MNLELTDNQWRVVAVRPAGWWVIDGQDCPVRLAQHNGPLVDAPIHPLHESSCCFSSEGCATVVESII